MVEKGLGPWKTGCREKLKIVNCYLGQIFLQIYYKYVGEILDQFTSSYRILYRS